MICRVLFVRCWGHLVVQWLKPWQSTLTQAFPPLLAPLGVAIALLAHQHSLQLLPLLLLPLTGQLRAGLLVLQHVFNVLPHLFKVAILCWAAVCVGGEHLSWLQHPVVGERERKCELETLISRAQSRNYFQIGASLILQVKDPLALFLITLLVLSNGEARPSGELAHRPLPWARLLRGHGSHHVDHLPSRELLDLNRITSVCEFRRHSKSICDMSLTECNENCQPTSSSGTPNLRSSCLAFLSDSLLKSASVPVTVFFTGCGSLSSWTWEHSEKVSLPLFEQKKEATVLKF